MKANLPLFLLAVVITACSSRQSESVLSYSDFPEERSLTATTIELDTALFRYPYRVRIEDDQAVVMDLHGSDHYFHVFHYPDFRYLTSFGRKGDAPTEMLSAENMRYFRGGLWTLDANKGELTEFVKASSGDSLLRHEVVSLDKRLLRALDFAVCDDSTYVIPDYSGESRFCWVNRKGKLIKKGGSIPSTNEDAMQSARPALAQGWRSFIDYNPRNDVMAAVTQLGEVLEIYHLKDSTHIVCTGPHGEPEFKISDSYAIPSGIMGFSDVQVTDRAIYAVFHGRTFKELIQQKEGHVVDGGQYIYVFSLTGEPLCKYSLDRYVYGIHVDEEKKIITATDVNNDQPIVEFRFG